MVAVKQAISSAKADVYRSRNQIKKAQKNGGSIFCEWAKLKPLLRTIKMANKIGY
jgi:hypothetical protein